MATILVTLDGSNFAEQALPHAVGRLQEGDELLLLLVVEAAPSLQMPGKALRDIDVTASQLYLERLARRLTERSLRVRCELRLGCAREEILATASREAASLIVIASHGRRGFTRWLLGSVAESVARQAPCPVWVVRCQAQPEFTLNEPWAEEVPPVSRVLVPLDTSASARDASEFVRTHLDRAAVSLHLLTATSIAWLGQTDVCGEVLAEIGRCLEVEAELLRQDGWKVETGLDPGSPAEAILDVAEDWRADLIVMASHTRTGPQRWFLGSVAEKVVRHATCPVALVRASKVLADPLPRR